MTDALTIAYGEIDRANAGESAHTRRRLLQGAAAGLGSFGLFGLAYDDEALAQMGQNDPQRILNVAATAEVLATIVNTLGPRLVARRSRRLDRITRLNIRAAAREELIHYNVLVGQLGAQPLTKRIWVPDAVFANKRSLLQTLEVGDQIFVNAYLIGTTVFGNAGNADAARYTGEFMGVEAVHRALARQSLGKLGNDRAFMRYVFTDIDTAVARLQAAGFGFGSMGSGRPGNFYEFDNVRRRTPNPAGVNTRRLA